jgi:hypothetical protein
VLNPSLWQGDMRQRAEVGATARKSLDWRM